MRAISRRPVLHLRLVLFLLVTAILLSVVGILAKNTGATATWNTVSNSTIGARYVELAIAPDDTIYVTYIIDDFHIGVSRLTASGYVQVGDPIEAFTNTGAFELQFDSTGTPHIAYYENIEYVNTVLVAKYDGTTWVSAAPPTGLPPIADPTIFPQDMLGGTLDFAIDSANNFYISYPINHGTSPDGGETQDWTSQLRVVKYNGASWQTLRDSTPVAGINYYVTQMGIDDNGNIYIAYDEPFDYWYARPKSTMYSVSDDTWYDNALSSIGSSNNIYDLVVDGDGNVYISGWFGDTGVGGIKKSTDGITYSPFINMTSNYGIASMTVDADNNLHVVYIDSSYVSRYSIYSPAGTLVSTTALRDPNYLILADAVFTSGLVVNSQGEPFYLNGIHSPYSIVTQYDDPVPTDVSLSNTSVVENTATNTPVGTLSTTDATTSDTFTYSLVTGTGSTDNASFSISGDKLYFASSPNYETKNSYSIRLQTRDAAGGTYEKAFTIAVTDANEAPTNIALSATSINENVAANTTVGTLSGTDPDASSTLTYSLVTGTGDTDNTSFNISSGALRISNSPDFEAKSSYSVRLRVTDAGSLSFEKVFTISVNDLNEAPTGLSLDATSVTENTATSTAVGTFAVTDPDANSSFGYSLVGGTDSDDNADFTITAGKLYFVATPNYESPSDADGNNSYKIRVQVSDGANTYPQTFTITVTDVNEAPTDLQPHAVGVNENTATSTTVWTPSVTDPDATNTFSYALVSGAGDEDNAHFTINTTTGALTFTTSPDYEHPADANSDNDYQALVQVTNGTFTYAQAITVQVANVVDPDSIVINNAETATPIEIVTPDSTAISCSSVIKEADNATQDADYDYPVGFVDFCFTTVAADNEVTVTFVTDKKAADLTLRKYNPTTGTYAAVSGAVLTDVTYNGQAAVRAVYTITDNGSLDLDPTAGAIKDPVGLATAVSNSGNTGGTTGTGSTSAPVESTASTNNSGLASTGRSTFLLLAAGFVLTSAGVAVGIALRRTKKA